MKTIPLVFYEHCNMNEIIDFINAYLDVLIEKFHSRDGFESLLCEQSIHTKTRGVGCCYNS